MTHQLASASFHTAPALMQAALLVDVGRFEMGRIPRPTPRPDEILLHVAAVGVCGTDQHIVSGAANYNRDASGRLIPLAEQPQILGHEIAGIVEAVGSEVSDLEPGDHVVVDQGRNCVSERRDPLCEYCSTGDSHQCDHYREHGITGLPGGFAEYLAIPAVNAIRVNPELDLASAALTEPLACVLHACEVLARTPARYGTTDDGRPLGRGTRDEGRGTTGRVADTVLILGAGPAGLLFVQVLRRVMGFAGTLLVVDPNARKRALAARFGAEVIDPGGVDVVEAVAEHTHGRRAEIVIEASGSAAAFVSIPRLLRKQGTLVLYGHGHAGADLSVLNSVQFLEPTLIAPTGASGRFDNDGRPSIYRRALRLIEDGTVDVSSLITHRYQSLGSVPEVFGGAHAAPEYIKGVVLV